ncbi:DUF6114 domain-containing protein [Thermomonospora umbrina]|uniref:SPW repeat-containing protein n=1 Tax=Thermomonospora umbrina TaxID=111806 RepID=A0A3D9SYK2_9ACTN|nr:DUF6114 domain-containing protein [Thermomonospora umbrina]REF01043.1 hypothetical protein DFJ69_6641 [Thermomonospora umbrina]
MSAVGAPTARGPLRRGGHAAARGWRWFAMFRRTRPFWGGLWLVLSGWVMIDMADFPLGVVLQGGWSTSAAYILGGAQILFGLVAWSAPVHRRLAGFLGVCVALAALVGTNLGGFLIGTLLGILGGSMVWGWGPKKDRGRRARG